ncbi:MAG: hypothetical protein WBB68_01090 [Candidatus Moraniibacteriota bacterium]
MSLLVYLWSHWLFVAFLAPFFWSLVNIIDVYFVSGVYEDEWDGILINSIFQALPWLLPVIGLVSFHYPGAAISGIALLAGSCLALSYFFYFKTLFISNDVVVVQALWNLSVPLVPFLAWFLVDEKLSLVHYIGIFLAFVGAMIFSLHQEIQSKNFTQVFTVMLGAIVFFSLSMVLQTEAYHSIGNDFWTGFLLFSAGATVTGLLLSFFDGKSIKDRAVHIFQMSKSFFLIFVLAETLNLLGVLVSQRAIDLSQAVSFVAVIGSLTPVFVLLVSFFLIFVFLVLNKVRARQIYQDQLIAPRTKILACCIIAVGIYLIS